MNFLAGLKELFTGAYSTRPKIAELHLRSLVHDNNECWNREDNPFESTSLGFQQAGATAAKPRIFCKTAEILGTGVATGISGYNANPIQCLIFPEQREFNRKVAI